MSIASAIRLLAGTAAAVVLSGCGGESGPDPERGAINDPFVVAVPQVGEIFDALSVLPAQVSAVTFNVYDWLFDRDHGGQVRPGLAESWDMSPDATELTIRLRRDVRFHNGAPMTAEDVVFSWNRLVEGGFSSRVTRQLESIDAVDRFTVRIRFSRPEVSFVPVGGFPVASRDYFEAVGERTFKEQPVATGPYRITGLVRGQYVDLERNDDYWGEKPAIRRARFAFVPEDTTRVAQLRAGEADMVMQVPYPLVPTLEEDPELETVMLSPGGMTMFLALKTDNPETPWADRRVREAIALAIDREAIVNDILLGYPVHYPFLAPGDNGYDPSLESHGYDPERARQLLREAGVDRLGFDLVYSSAGITGQKETAEAVALYLNEVGIEARATPIQGPQLVRWVLRASKNPEQDYVAAFVGGIAGRSEPASAINAQFSSETPFAWYVNPEINRRVHDMAVMPDADRRADAIREIGRLVTDDMRYIPMWTSSHVYGMKRCIEFTPTLGEYDLLLLRDVSIAECEMREANATQ